MKKVIICKDEDSTQYEVWEKFKNDDETFKFNFIDIFESSNEAILYCETNNFKIETSYGEKGEYK